MYACMHDRCVFERKQISTRNNSNTLLVFHRGFSAPSYSDIDVALGTGLCSNITYISDEKLTCLSPPGSGLTQVSITVHVAGLSMSRQLAYNYTYNEFYFAGILAQDSQPDVGFVSAYLASEGTRKQPLHLTGSVLAVASFDGHVYAGGTFASAGGISVGRIVAWQGTGGGAPLGYGVDGAVRAMTSFMGVLVVGGEFTRCVSRRLLVCVCVYMCVYIYIYIYIHAHMNACITYAALRLCRLDDAHPRMHFAVIVS
jgi:hypothetical protein